jgi:ribosomal protein S18 acetylase RimI-like enzyme
MESLDPDHTIRNARQEDIPVVADILGEAFRDDPVFVWFVSQPERRHRSVPDYFLTVARHLYLPHHQVYLTESAKGAALWLPPGVSVNSIRSLALLPMLFRLYSDAGLAGLRRASMIATAMAAHHPEQPHYYLHALGVRSSRQGQGIGSDLIRHVTSRCDRDHVLAYLENSNQRNLPLYKRNGFKVTQTWQVPGGPPIWFMVRIPGDSIQHTTT